jgi:hypothetical protein
MEGVNLSAIAFDASGKSVVTVGRKRDPGSSPGTNRGPWVLAFGALNQSARRVDFETSLALESCDPYEISLSPDGTHAALNCTGVGVMVVERGSFARNVLNSVYGCHFGVSNDKLLCAGGRIEIRSRFGGDLQSLPPENFDISSAIFSPDGSRLAQVERDGVVVVTDSITGDDLWWKKAPADLHFYTTSGDGQTLYARDATASYAVAWDGKSEIRSHPNLLAVGFDGRRIAVLDHWLDVPRANGCSSFRFAIFWV